MSKSNAFETDLLAYVFNATALPAGYAGPFYIRLHSADPGEAGTAVTNEVSYTGYNGVSVARTSGGWTVTGNQVVNAGTVTFPACTAGSATATHFSICTTQNGAGTILYSGALNANLAISAGITPSFAAGALVVTED